MFGLIIAQLAGGVRWERGGERERVRRGERGRGDRQAVSLSVSSLLSQALCLQTPTDVPTHLAWRWTGSVRWSLREIKKNTIPAGCAGPASCGDTLTCLFMHCFRCGSVLRISSSASKA